MCCCGKSGVCSTAGSFVRSVCRVILCPLAPTRSQNDLGWNLGQRHDAVEDAEFEAGSGHPVNRTTGFILTDGEAALMIDGADSFCAVRTHPGQDDSHGAILKSLRG